MPRGNVHTIRPMTPNMIEALQCASRGEHSDHFTDRSEHGGPGYARQALLDREFITDDNKITERGRAALAALSSSGELDGEKK